MGILMNIILGIIGAALFNFIFGTLLGLYAADNWLGYLIAGFIGACILIWIARMVRRSPDAPADDRETACRPRQAVFVPLPACPRT